MIPLFSVSPDDYTGVSNEIVSFATGDINQTHTITINQDDICAMFGTEQFFSTITGSSGVGIIEVIHPESTVIIDDLMELECKCIEHECIGTIGDLGWCPHRILG